MAVSSKSAVQGAAHLQAAFPECGGEVWYGALQAAVLARSGKGAAQGAAAAAKLLCRLGKVAGQGAVQAAVGVVKLLVTMRWGSLAKRAVFAEV